MAAIKWWLFDKDWNYLIIRKSKHAKVPHFLAAKHIEGVPVKEMKPVEAKKGLLGMFWYTFYGKWHIREGIGEESETQTEKDKE